ncbi:ead/Ea22-like family protein [Enterobacter hormaechei]|nr:ead/Ea22-like family protein [Enterobacter hormaechei]EMA8105520.1 ead/Ea22-like family protein [Enterobacter hormaechei]
MSNIDKQALREAAEKALPAMKRLLMMPNDELFDEALLNVDGDVDAANAFNLLTGPETVLALLDELDAKETENERMALELLNRSGEIEGLRQRIAELESREINLPPYSFFDFKQGSPFKSGAYCHIDSVNKELSKHCIKMIAAAGKGE